MEPRRRDRQLSFSSNKFSDAESFPGAFQDFGADFEFKTDENALKSIIENRGIEQAQRYEVMESLKKGPQRSALAPIRCNKKNASLEFFEGKNGGIFFRRKVQTPVQDHVSETLEKSSKFDFRPVRFGINRSANKENRGGQCSTEKGLSGTKVQTRGWDISQTERKHPPVMFHAPHRQSISERKPKSLLPQPMDTSAARKSLYFGKEKKDVFKKPEVPKNDNRNQREEPSGLPMPPLTQLSRESLHLIPRESLAWIAQLPRDSATFFELEKMMGDDDKKLINEDDTWSFEAMESRLKTPLRITTTSRFKTDEPSEKSEQTEEEISTPVKESMDISVELINMPADPILSTPTIKSSSMSNLTVTEPEVSIGRSQSEERVNSNIVVSKMISADELLKFDQELQEYRREQDELERQQQELFKKISERKNAFKEQWGVSPMSINKVRTKLPPKPAVNLADPKPILPSALKTPCRPQADSSDESQAPNTEIRKVRFDSGNNESKYLTPDSSFQITPLPDNPSANNSISNRSFASLKNSFSFLQTPGTAQVAHPKKRLVQRYEDGEDPEPVEHDDEEDVQYEGNELGAPTPVALKSLSERVKAEFARLYADSDESQEVSSDIMKQLKF